jgi:uncharacterized membrane protein
MLVSEAVAGHAGDAPIGFLPHELMGGMAVLIIVGFVLILLGAAGVWLLFRIERRLRKLQ